MVPGHPMASENQEEQAGLRPSEDRRCLLDRERAGPRPLPASTHAHTYTRITDGDEESPRTTSAFKELARQEEWPGLSAPHVTGLRPEDLRFQISLDYTVRLRLKKEKSLVL